MSILKEYIKMVSKGVKDFDKVAEGWINVYKEHNNLLSEEELKVILERRLICESCPLNSVKAKTSQEYKDLYGKPYESERNILHCSICACPILAKTSSLLSNCGLEDYEGKQKVELKWKSIKQK
jgi:hypothetical protein